MLKNKSLLSANLNNLVTVASLRGHFRLELTQDQRLAHRILVRNLPTFLNRRSHLVWDNGLYWVPSQIGPCFGRSAQEFVFAASRSPCPRLSYATKCYQYSESSEPSSLTSPARQRILVVHNQDREHSPSLVPYHTCTYSPKIDVVDAKLM